ncbi:MAG TPA: hypothetical protein VFQ05_06305 [Candidatus Eisenbacteria bacterium]|nr:hypothetical protein [Candidatus Eisenbacteria bacterium]
MKRLSLCLAGAALLLIPLGVRAQTSAPQDSLTAKADSVIAQVDSMAVKAASTAADTAAAHAGAAATGAAGAAGVSTTPTTTPTAAPTTTTPTTATAPPPAAQPVAPTGTAAAPTTASAADQSGLAGTPIYVGGAVGFSFWSDYTRISLEPFVGYKLRPKLSVGGKLRYEYLNDKRQSFDYKAHNFGASALANYRLLPQIYGHGELAVMKYDYPSQLGGDQTVPFLLVGGGYMKQIRPGVSAYAEAVWDLLNDKNSPYEEWQPVVSVGVTAGF